MCKDQIEQMLAERDADRICRSMFQSDIDYVEALEAQQERAQDEYKAEKNAKWRQ